MGIIRYCFRHMIRQNGLRPETESMLPARLMFQANLGVWVFFEAAFGFCLMVKGTESAANYSWLVVHQENDYKKQRFHFQD